jgi:predicted  nucleic acid-binding Zn-ribbon protein
MENGEIKMINLKAIAKKSIFFLITMCIPCWILFLNEGHAAEESKETTSYYVISERTGSENCQWYRVDGDLEKVKDTFKAIEGVEIPPNAGCSGEKEIEIGDQKYECFSKFPSSKKEDQNEINSTHYVYVLKKAVQQEKPKVEPTEINEEAGAKEQKELEEITTQINKLNQDLDALKTEKEDSTQKVEELKKNKSGLEEDIEKLLNQKNGASRELTRLEERIEELKKEENKLKYEIKRKLGEEVNELEKKKNSLKNETDKLERRRNGLNTEIKKLSKIRDLEKEIETELAGTGLSLSSDSEGLTRTNTTNIVLLGAMPSPKIEQCLYSILNKAKQKEMAADHIICIKGRKDDGTPSFYLDCWHKKSPKPFRELDFRLP